MVEETILSWSSGPSTSLMGAFVAATGFWSIVTPDVPDQPALSRDISSFIAIKRLNKQLPA